MIAQARQNYPKLKFSLADARAFQCDEPFDGVFSNAALHWIPEASSVIARVAGCLKPGGRLILEMGGKGNIARIVRALTMAIEEAGYPARNPWYFPSAAEYSSLLEERNFEIEALWTIERWNKLEHPKKVCANYWKCLQDTGLKWCRRMRARPSLATSKHGCGRNFGATEPGGPTTAAYESSRGSVPESHYYSLSA